MAVALSASPTAAQYTNDPFFEWTVIQSQAIGIELVMQRLRIIEAVGRPFDRQFPEIVETLSGSDFERFGGALAESDAELAAYLFSVLNAIAEGVEGGGVLEDDGPLGRIDVNMLIPIAWELLDEAYDVIAPPAIRDLPAFKGGVIAQLLLGEGGVAEGLEEAIIERWEFANGWGATQRVKELWSEVSGLATPAGQADVEEMIAAFDAIYPSAVPPDNFRGIDPEEAETPAQRMTGLLESIVDAALYSGRDQIKLLDHLVGLTGEACEDYAEGWLRGAQMTIYAVLDHYAGETTGLGALIGLFAPDVNDSAMAALRNLVTVEDATPGTTPARTQLVEEQLFRFEYWLAGESAERWELPPDQRPARVPAPEACGMLLDALRNARAVLGG